MVILCLGVFNAPIRAVHADASDWVEGPLSSAKPDDQPVIEFNGQEVEDTAVSASDENQVSVLQSGETSTDFLQNEEASLSAQSQPGDGQNLPLQEISLVSLQAEVRSVVSSLFLRLETLEVKNTQTVLSALQTVARESNAVQLESVLAELKQEQVEESKVIVLDSDDAAQESPPRLIAIAALDVIAGTVNRWAKLHGAAADSKIVIDVIKPKPQPQEQGAGHAVPAERLTPPEIVDFLRLLIQETLDHFRRRLAEQDLGVPAKERKPEKNNLDELGKILDKAELRNNPKFPLDLLAYAGAREDATALSEKFERKTVDLDPLIPMNYPLLGKNPLFRLICMMYLNRPEVMRYFGEMQQNAAQVISDYEKKIAERIKKRAKKDDYSIIYITPEGELIKLTEQNQYQWRVLKSGYGILGGKIAFLSKAQVHANENTSISASGGAA